MPESVLVTGGAGFIGLHLCRRLLADAYKVTVLDNLSTGLEKNIIPGVNFIRGDVSDPESLEKLPKGISLVFHLAAQSSGEASFDNPLADFKSNTMATFMMLQWSRKNGIRKFIYTSSMAAYGISSEIPLNENMLCSPKSFYGAAKLASETYIRLFQNLGLETVIFRPFNVYGPGQNLSNKKQGMASIYLSYILENNPVPVKGSLDRFRDQLYVSDAVNAFVKAIPASVVSGKTFNLATGKKTTVRELITKLLAFCGKSENYPIIQEAGTSGDIFGCFADVSSIRSELGWTAEVDIDSGLKKMADFFIEKRKND